MKDRRVALLTGASVTALWALLIGLRLFGPLDYQKSGLEALPIVAVFFAGVWYVVAFTILRPGGGSQRPRPVAIVSEAGFRISGFAVYGLVALSIVYLGSVLLDESQALTVGITEARYEGIRTGPNPTLAGAVSSYTAGIPVILAAVLLCGRTKLDRRITRPLLWMLVGTCFAAFFLSGGRNSFFIGVVFVVVAGVLRTRAGPKAKGAHRPVKRTFGQRILLIGAMLVGVSYSLYLFAERAAIRNTDLLGSLAILGSDYGAQVTQVELPGYLQGVYSVFILLTFYVTHPLGYVEEYALAGYEPMTGGGYSFHLLVRTVDVLIGTDFGLSAMEKLITPGVYLTLPGSLFIDFGYAGAFSAGLFSTWVVIRYSTRAVMRRNMDDLLVASFGVSLLIFSPVYSITGIAIGPSLLILVVAFKLFRRFEAELARSAGSRGRGRIRPSPREPGTSPVK